MEQDILKQIYFGEIVPWENRNDRTPEMAEIADRIDGEIGNIAFHCDILNQHRIDAHTDND